MRKNFTVLGIVSLFALPLAAQVTQINSNKSLSLVGVLTSSKTLFYSDVDDALWVSEGDLPSTQRLTNTISGGFDGTLLNGKFIFAGSTAAEGNELFITDGTMGGTVLLKNIVDGIAGSSPSDFTTHNGFVYFTAETPAEGRELWRTNGTSVGTTIVKDIKAGAMGSNESGDYNMFPLGNLLLFSADGNNTGTELWKTDGTAEGTVQVKDINPGASSSEPDFFWPYGNLLLFTARTLANGREVWRSDGTEAGTFLLKDINPGTGSSTEIEIFPGFSLPISIGFHVFENKAYFSANDGVNSGNIFTTDGSIANTTLLKTVITGPSLPIILLFNSINLPGKFIFSVSDGVNKAEIWQSDGTPGGTSVFKSFYMDEDNIYPVIYKNFNNFLSQGGNDVLFQGNKFFFAAAGSMADGTELWVSDGTLGGTSIVKNIGPGSSPGVNGFSYFYTSSTFFFAANNSTSGNELWKTDGTESGTLLVQDINPGSDSSEPQLMVLNNGKIFFGATDGDNAAFDLFVIDGVFTPLPALIESFSVIQSGADAQLNWVTLTENNTSHFTVERSNDGNYFLPIGHVSAAGNSTSSKPYYYTDSKIGFPQAGKLFYRIATTDRDGTKTFSRVAVLSAKPQSWDVRILSNYPGAPVALQMQGLTQPVNIRVSDQLGRVVLTRKLDQASYFQMPLSRLAKGIYTITIQHGTEIRSIRVVQ